jgi:hypothetical protein
LSVIVSTLQAFLNITSLFLDAHASLYLLVPACPSELAFGNDDVPG